MASFLLRRLLLAVPLALGVVLLTIASLDLIPGDPAALMLGQSATKAAVEELRSNLRLDDPLLVRYARYVTGLVQGDFGTSFREHRKISAILSETLPYTLQLAAAAITLAVLLGIPLGLLAGSRPGSFIDGLIRLVSLVGLSMPVFWTGLLLMVFFSVNLGWLPVAGAGTWKHLVLPSVTLALPSLAVVARMTRSGVLEVQREEYIRTAAAKGLGRRSILYKHTLRNALVPVVTALGLELGQMLGGAVLTETVFAWPGIGRLTIYSIFNRDYILVQGLVVVLALIYIGVNLLIDASYGLIDPRITYS